MILAASLFFGTLLLLTWGGARLRRSIERRSGPSDAGAAASAMIVPAALGLMALLLGFTFALALDRYEERRQLVLAEANALGTAHLQAQLLPEPHRAQISTLLSAYVDNRIELADATADRRQALMAHNAVLMTQLWSATEAAFATVKGLPLSATFVTTINGVLDLDTSRKMGRQARVPDEVLHALLLYALTTAAMLGFLVRSRDALCLAGLMHLLLLLSLLLIIDIDRPTWGNIRESQLPMEMLRQSLIPVPVERTSP